MALITQTLMTPLEATSQPYFSAATERYAYGSEDSTLIIRNLDGELVRELPLPGNPKWEYYLADAAWSADGERLALQVIERSNYTGKQFNVTNYILTPANWGIQELATIETYNSTIRWSPDEESLILSGTVPAGDGYALSLSRLNPSNRNVTTYDDTLNITAPDYLTFSRIGWLVTGGINRIDKPSLRGGLCPTKQSHRQQGDSPRLACGSSR